MHIVSVCSILLCWPGPQQVQSLCQLAAGLFSWPGPVIKDVRGHQIAESTAKKPPASSTKHQPTNIDEVRKSNLFNDGSPLSRVGGGSDNDEVEDEVEEFHRWVVGRDPPNSPVLNGVEHGKLGDNGSDDDEFFTDNEESNDPRKFNSEESNDPREIDGEESNDKQSSESFFLCRWRY